jgi:putative inorganic carbon (hco3(-)) transporter
MPAFFLSALYLGLMLASIADLVPGVAELRLNLIVGVAAALAVMLSGSQEWTVWRHQVFMLLAGFMGAIAVSRAVNGWMGGGVIAVWQYLPVALLLPLLGATITSVERLSRLRFVLLVVAFVFIAGGVYAVHTGDLESPFVLSPHNPNEEVAQESMFLRTRGLGTLKDPNDFAQFLLICLALLGGTTVAKPRSLASFIRLVCFGLLLTGVLYTKSRGGLIGMAALIFLYMWDRFRWLGAGVVGFCGLLALPFAGSIAGREVSIQGGEDRLAIWSDALGLIKHSPVLGNGYGSAPDLLGITAHNTYLLALVELGLVGFLFWIGMLLVVLVPLWKLAAVPDAEAGDDIVIRSWARAVRNALVVFMVTSFFLSREYQAPVIILIAMAFGVLQIHAAKDDGVEQLDLAPREWLPLAGVAAALAMAIPYAMVRLGHFTK